MKTTTLIILTLILTSCSLEKRANRGDLNACYSIVEKENNYFHKKPNNKQKEKIIKYCIKGIEIDTNYQFGSFFYINLAKNISNKSKSYFYYQKAANLNDAEGEWITGLNYLEGHTVITNNDSALYWINRASLNENNLHYAAIASTELGDLYKEGKICKADSLLSLHYYKQACACFENYGYLLACDSVVKYYNEIKNLKDTTEISIYKELARKKRQKIGYK
jgi:TPR repeat protein